jgi:cyclic pyranopterin monophosphate synthase
MTDKSEKLTHVADSGEARMVDVSAKSDTQRTAVATGIIRMKAETLAAIRNAEVKKGDVLGVARVAAIMAAKKTSDLIPLCHPLALTDVQISLVVDETLPGLRAKQACGRSGRPALKWRRSRRSPSHY